MDGLLGALGGLLRADAGKDCELSRPDPLHWPALTARAAASPEARDALLHDLQRAVADVHLLRAGSRQEFELLAETQPAVAQLLGCIERCMFHGAKVASFAQRPVPSLAAALSCCCCCCCCAL